MNFLGSKKLLLIVTCTRDLWARNRKIVILGIWNPRTCHGIPNVNMFGFMLPLVDYGNISCSPVNELQQNYIMYSTKIDCLVEDSSGLHFTYVTVCPSFVSNSLNKITTTCMLLDQSELLTRFWTDHKSPE